MADNLGRVSPVVQHLLDHDAREELYQGRRSRKQPGAHQANLSADPEDLEKTEESAAKNHIDLRI